MISRMLMKCANRYRKNPNSLLSKWPVNFSLMVDCLTLKHMVIISPDTAKVLVRCSIWQILSACQLQDTSTLRVSWTIQFMTTLVMIKNMLMSKVASNSFLLLLDILSFMIRISNQPTVRTICTIKGNSSLICQRCTMIRATPQITLNMSTA